MDRRVAGLGVLMGVVVAVLAASALSPAVVGGSPNAVPIPGPPSVGDCLLTPVNLGPVSVNGRMGFPPGETGACAGRHLGEVLQVKPEFPVIPWGPSEDYPASTDPQVEAALTCPTGLAYIGLPGIGSEADRVGGWYPALNLATGLVSPDARQQAAGQQWAACVLLNPSRAGTIGGSYYAGRLQGALPRGVLPDRFGQCSNGRDRPVDDCSVPHDRQDLGIADVAEFGLSSTTRSAACSRLAALLTLMPDPTARGRLALTVDVQRFDEDGIPLAATAPHRAGEGGFVTCTVRVVGAIRLDGSLLGLGSRPLPLVH